MAIYVNTNVGGIRGRNQLNNINNNLNTTYQRLSSGLRINSAKDDAAGLAISDRMTSQINGLGQANRNIADGIALAQTMEGGIDEISNSLQQVRTLMVQAGNGTNTTDDRKAIGNQINALLGGINDIASKTKFGGKTILDGWTTGTTTSIYSNGSGTDIDGKITFQTGANGGDTLELALSGFNLSKGTVFADIKLNKAGTADVGSVDNTDFGKVVKSLVGTGTMAQAEFDSALGAIDKALGKVDGERAKLGAFQNRMESTIRNQSNVIANQSDARSRIRDTDFAEESAKLSQQNILQQASMSMLMQANARPQMALSLLG